MLETIDSTITVADLNYPANVEPAGDVNQNVAWIQPPRVIEEDEIAAVDDIDVEGAEPTEEEEGEGQEEA